MYFTLAIITIMLWQVAQGTGEDRGLMVAFLDVGQGDSIFIESPSGIQVLIDGGPSGPRTLRVLSQVMPFYDRSIDMVMATHPDSDHIGGLIDVLKRYKVDFIIRPGIGAKTTATNSFLLEIARANHDGAEERLARAGQVYHLGVDKEGVPIDLNILFPDRDPTGMGTNEASIVARLTYGKTSVLLTGDSPKNIEKYLVDIYGKKMKSDILKLGHHGSKTSSSKRFLASVQPQWAVVSAGDGNRYGHPHHEVVNRIKSMDINIKDTSKDSTIIFESDGKQWFVQ